MELNQEEEKHPAAADIGDVRKEIDQGPSDDAIATLDECLGNPEVLNSVLSTPTMGTYISGLQNQQQSSTPINSPKNPPKDEDADSVRSIDGYLRKPEIMRSVVATSSMQRYLDRSSPVDPHPHGSRSGSLTTTPTRVPSVYDLLQVLGSLSASFSPTKRPAAYSSPTPSDFFTPRNSPLVGTQLVYASTTVTPTSNYTGPPTPASSTTLGISNTLDDGGEDDDKQIREEISKDFEVEYLISALKEIPEVIPKDVYKRRKLKKQAAKQARILRRKHAKAWKELITLKQKSDEEKPVVDDRWSFSEEVEKLFNDALKLGFPEIEDEEPCVMPCIEEEHGDFQCENVLSLWPKLRKKEGTAIMYPKGPIKVGRKIKMNLQLLGPKMIERPPRVHGAGFVTIKLSGKFMAKSLHKMLRHGIDTCAPKLLMECVKVNYPSCDMADLLPIDLLRRDLIKETSINMLKYCEIDVEFSKPCKMDLPKEENDKFRMEKRDDGDVLIFRNHGGEEKPLIHAKRDGWSGINPMEDVAYLWYELEEEEADWIIWVTPIQQQEYVKMCIKAAKHAGWLPLHTRDSPRASYTGFKLFDTKLKHEDLSLLLDKAKLSCEAAAVKLGYTGEQVAKCALKYTILKNSRFADYTLNFQEMLDPVGNTFVYLLNTRFRISSLTRGSSQAIMDMLEVLKLGKGQIWKDGLQRVLVQHLLRFTEVILEATLPVFPHLLCEYVYDISKNFNSVFFENGLVETTTNLLLCEATRVVLDKSFELLGLTPQSSSLGQALSSLLLTERSNHKDDPPKVNTRFELFSLYPYITSDRDVKKALMFGRIGISDAYSVLWEEWGLADTPDHGFVSLFDENWSKPVEITSGGPMYLGDPFSKHLVPFSSAMEACFEFYAFTEANDDVFELGRSPLDTDFEEFLEEEEAEVKRCRWISKGNHGCVAMYYLLLKRAVDSCVKVSYIPTQGKDTGGEVFGEIMAYYGGKFFEDGDRFERKFYTATILRNRFDPSVPDIHLDRSMLAVPRGGSVVFEVILWDTASWNVILSGRCEIGAGSRGVETIHGSRGSLKVSMEWPEAE